MTELSAKLRGRLAQIEARHRELGEAMSDPSVVGDRDKLMSSLKTLDLGDVADVSVT